MNATVYLKARISRAKLLASTVRIILMNIVTLIIIATPTYVVHIYKKYFANSIISDLRDCRANSKPPIAIQGNVEQRNIAYIISHRSINENKAIFPQYTIS